MSSASSAKGSASSSCSWDVMNSEDSAGSYTKFCSLCGLDVENICFKRPFCDICVLCESCQGVNLSNFPTCEHKKLSKPSDVLECENDNLSNKVPCIPSDTQLVDHSEGLLSTDKPDSTIEACTTRLTTESVGNEKANIIENVSSQTFTRTENRAAHISDRGPSLTAHIMEALENTDSAKTTPCSLPFMKSELTPSVCSNVPKGLCFSRKVTRLPDDGSYSSHPSTSSPVASVGLNEPITSATFSNSFDHNTNSSVSTSTTASTSESSGNSTAAKFLKSVALHSASVLNNFDCIPVDPREASTRTPSTQHQSPTKSVQVSSKQNTTRESPAWRSLALDDAQIFELLKPKEVPKSVLEMASYNLR